MLDRTFSRLFSNRPRGRRRYGVATLLFNAALAWLVAAHPVAAAEGCRILALGDSLTAGYGLPIEQSFPVRLEQRLRQQGIACEVINAGVSGDTTASGLARLDWALADQPDYAIVALGANDALRGIDPEEAYANLNAILTRLGEEDVEVLLAGMLAPRNWGREYGDAFAAVYERLAEKHDVLLYPFFLEGVALDPRLNQEDRIHPNAEGVEIMVEGILPYVTELVRRGNAA